VEQSPYSSAVKTGSPMMKITIVGVLFSSLAYFRWRVVNRRRCGGVGDAMAMTDCTGRALHCFNSPQA